MLLNGRYRKASDAALRIVTGPPYIRRRSGRSPHEYSKEAAMSIAETRRQQIYPVLTAAQIEQVRRFASAEPREFGPGEVVHQAGERAAPAWLVLRGSIEIELRDALGRESGELHVAVGMFTGEMGALAGKRAFSTGRAGARGCTAIPFDAPHLRTLMVGSAEVGEIFMRAFILRRVALITEGGAGSVLV